MNKKRIKVLLIEDNKTDHLLIKRCLGNTRADFELHWVQEVQAGISKLAATNFDVVLTDLSLPDCRGLDTVRRIRDRDRSIAIVVLTTLDNIRMELESLALGVQEYLVKSDATPHTLERAIHHAMQRQQNLEEIKRLLADLKASHELLAENTELLKSKNRRLRKLYKTAHRFVDNVSHEFRTPLTVIKDYVSLVREGMVGEVNAEQRRMLDIAAVRTDDLNNMVDDMLDVSKLESGLLGAWRRNCRLSDAVEMVRPTLEKKAEIKEVSFEIAVDEQLPEVYCDSEKVGRVIINLVTNAMKFCGEPGIVRLWAKEDTNRGEIVVGVTDNGAGIEEEGLLEIFKRFKQLKTNLKSSTKGFGLGLNIAKELVDLNFGDMRVESEPDRGSTFSFTVPLADPKEVMRRYLQRVERFSNGLRMVSLVAAQIDESVKEADAEDVDGLLNYLLRRNDLLFRVGSRNWLFVLSTPPSEAGKFVTRARREWKKTNRNRPFGPLPAFELTVEGSWQIATQTDVILERFRAAVQPELAHG